MLNDEQIIYNNNLALRMYRISAINAVFHLFMNNFPCPQMRSYFLPDYISDSILVDIKVVFLFVVPGHQCAFDLRSTGTNRPQSYF